MPNKTLYITDLDGTLLTNAAEVSDYTEQVVHRLWEKGVLFSYATARAYTSASRITKRITPSIPVVLCNGTFVADAATGRRISAKYFTSDETQYILKIFGDHGVSPIVYSVMDGDERYSYSMKDLPEASARFLRARSGDPRENPVTPDKLGAGEVFHFSSLGDAESLSGIYHRLRYDFPSELYLDRYFHEMFLEIHPKGATKAEGVLELKRILGCDRVVCFGDGTNDIPMFEIADECYAMDNADPELKEIATAVIGDNEQGGVVRWFEENVL